MKYTCIVWLLLFATTTERAAAQQNAPMESSSSKFIYVDTGELAHGWRLKDSLFKLVKWLPNDIEDDVTVIFYPNGDLVTATAFFKTRDEDDPKWIVVKNYNLRAMQEKAKRLVWKPDRNYEFIRDFPLEFTEEDELPTHTQTFADMFYVGDSMFFSEHGIPQRKMRDRNTVYFIAVPAIVAADIQRQYDESEAEEDTPLDDKRRRYTTDVRYLRPAF